MAKRVIAYSHLEYERGYTEPSRIHYQNLQEKRWYGWQTIDKEIVPSHVKIAQGCFGDTGGWKSKFSEYIQ